jgi:hypothetical protein
MSWKEFGNGYSFAVWIEPNVASNSAKKMGKLYKKVVIMFRTMAQTKLA